MRANRRFGEAQFGLYLAGAHAAVEQPEDLQPAGGQTRFSAASRRDGFLRATGDSEGVRHDDGGAAGEALGASRLLQLAQVILLGEGALSVAMPSSSAMPRRKETPQISRPG